MFQQVASFWILTFTIIYKRKKKSEELIKLFAKDFSVLNLFLYKMLPALFKTT